MNDPSEPRARSPYLFLLARPSLATRSEAANRLREMGLTVVAQYGRVAVEALARPDEALSAQDLGLFSGVFKGAVSAQHFERLTDEQRRVVEQWNTRFAGDYRRLKEDKTLLGRSWGHPDTEPPAPHSAIDPEEFMAFLEEYERRTGSPAMEPATEQRPTEQRGRRGAPRRPQGPMTPEAFVSYERDLSERFKDPTAAYHLARLAFNLGPTWYERIRGLRPDLVAELIERFFREAACWELTGEIAVGVVLVVRLAGAGQLIALVVGPRPGTLQVAGAVAHCVIAICEGQVGQHRADQPVEVVVGVGVGVRRIRGVGDERDSACRVVAECKELAAE